MVNCGSLMIILLLFEHYCFIDSRCQNEKLFISNTSLCVSLFSRVSEQGNIGLSKFLHFMTSLGRIPPLGLKRKIEVEFSNSTSPTFFAETCGFVLRVPTVHETFETFQEKFFRSHRELPRLWLYLIFHSSFICSANIP